MKPKAKFVNSLVRTAKSDMPQMPWARGARRAAMIARRQGTAESSPKRA